MEVKPNQNGDAEIAMELSVSPSTTEEEHYTSTTKCEALITTISNDEDDEDDNDDGVKDDAEDEPPSAHSTSSSSLCLLYRGIYRLRRLARDYSRAVKRACLGLLLLAYLGYFVYCMYFRFGDEPSIRLLVVTIFGLLCLVKPAVKRSLPVPTTLTQCFRKNSKKGRKLRKIIRWCLYALSVGGAVTLLAVDVVVKRPQNLVCLAGLAALVLVSVLLSRQPEKINWHAVFWGMGLQFWFAVLIGKTSFGRAAFQWLALRTVEFLKFADTGSIVVFGTAYLDHMFIFQIMPTMIFFNSMLCVLYYLGVVQVIFAEFGRFLGFCLGTSPIESVAAAANLFLSMLETPLLIKPFIKNVTQSELFAIMTAGYASIAGSLLWAFAAYGASINHILTASVMSAPAALAFAKMLFPDERKPSIKAEDAYKVDIRQYGSLLGAMSTGANVGLKMAGLVVVNLMVFAAALDFLDHIVLWFAQRAGVEDFTLSTGLMAYVLYPVTYLMGIEAADCFIAARLLGIKILTVTTVSFIELGNIITNGQRLQTYVETYNGTWTYIGNDIFLEATNTTLTGGVVSERTGVLATYMICGLSSLASIGITVGSYIVVAPARTRDIFRTATVACLAGNLACFSTACVAGLLYTD